MYTSCFNKHGDIGEFYSDSNNSSNSPNTDSFEKYMNPVHSNENFLIKPKRIPIKIILSDNEEVISTQNFSEQNDNMNISSVNNSLSPSQINMNMNMASSNYQLAEHFIKFSENNTSNVSIGTLGNMGSASGGNFLINFFKKFFNFK